MTVETIHFLLAMTSYQLKANPANREMTEEKYERNRMMNGMYLRAIAELMELLPEEERKKVPVTVAMDEEAFREWLHMGKDDSQVVRDKSEGNFDIQDSC